MSPSRLNQLASLGRSALLLAATLGLAAGSAGCFLTGDNGSPGAPVATASQVTVDTGAKLDVTAGQLQGIFVEYAGAGAWNVYTSCDTVADGNSCVFDLTLTTTDPKGFSKPAGDNLEPADTVDLQPDGSLHLVFNTASGLDGATFSTTEGAILQLDASFNDTSAAHLVNWISGGVVQNGAPSNPVDFAPSTP
jgi:hypothetical protein